MLIIEGKNGKSLFIQEMMNQNKRGSLILDSVGAVGLSVEDGSTHYILPKDTALSEIEEFLYTEDLSEFTRVILLLNINKEKLYDFRKLSHKFSQYKFIITVQTEDDDIKTYEY